MDNNDKELEFSDYVKKLTKVSNKNKTGIIVEILFLYYEEDIGKNDSICKSYSYVLKDDYEKIYKSDVTTLVKRFIDFSNMGDKDKLNSATNIGVNIYIIDIDSYRKDIDNGYGILYKIFKWNKINKYNIQRFEVYGSKGNKQFRKELSDYSDNIIFLPQGTKVKFRDVHGTKIYDGIIVCNFEYNKRIFNYFPEGYISDLYSIVYENPRKDEPDQDPYLVTFGNNRFAHRMEIIEAEETPTGMDELNNILSEKMFDPMRELLAKIKKEIEEESKGEVNEN